MTAEDMRHPGEIAADRCPPDVQEYGQRNGLPEFARATWQAGFVDGYRFAAALRSSHRDGAEAMREDCARAAGQHIREIIAPHSSYAGSVEDAVRAVPIPGKIDAG